MKILLICYQFDLNNSPRAYRWQSIVTFLRSQNNQVDVVCKKCNNNNNYAVNTSNSNARIFNKNTIAKKVLKFIYRKTWRLLYWPDSACLWFFNGYFQSKKLLNINTYDMLITVSHPFTCHLIGYFLKKKHPALNWRVDIGDPFSFLKDIYLNNRLLYRYLNSIAEKKVLFLVDKIFVTTTSLLEKYVKEWHLF